MGNEEYMRNPYDAIADEWHAAARGFRARVYVDRILDHLEPGASVLDLGCGTGIPIAQYVAQRGFRVTGVDTSERMLAFARQAVPGGVFIRADMLELRLDDRVDAVIAWDSVFHIDRRHHAALFGRIREVLEDGGWLLLSAGGTSEEGFESEMYGHTFYYSGYAPEQTLGLLEAAGFTIDHVEVDDPSSRGHVAIIARVLGGGGERAGAP
jgi:cyclopropane fatty-acyl-phospholipid synthase-like methyltransferase